MDNKNNNHESGNGFLLGIIIGSVVTLLFTTKKGREIVRDLTEKGASKLSEIQENIDKAVVTEEVVENDYLEPEDRPVEQVESEKPKLLAKESTSSSNIKTEKSRSEKPSQSPKPERAVKRLFRMKKS